MLSKREAEKIIRLETEDEDIYPGSLEWRKRILFDPHPRGKGLPPPKYLPSGRPSASYKSISLLRQRSSLADAICSWMEADFRARHPRT